MKIVHLMYWYIQNMGYQENFLPAEQKKLGHDIIIITSNRLPYFQAFNIKSRFQKSGKIWDKGVLIERLPVVVESKKHGLIIVKGIRKKLKEYKPDIVHVHGTFTSISIQSILFQKKIGYQLFIDDHSHVKNLDLNNILIKIAIWFGVKFFYFYKNRIKSLLPVAVCSFKILNTFFKDFKKELLPLGANNQLFQPDLRERERIRKKYDIGSNDVLLITSGKLNFDKDIDILIKAFNLVNEKKSYKLMIIGNGTKSYMDFLNSLINQNLNSKVKFIDFMKNAELNQYYNAADIGIWPGDPTISVLEAISAGLPVIVPDKDDAYTVLVENRAVSTFKRKNVSSLVTSIDLLSIDEERKKIRENGQLLIKEELNWHQIAKSSIEIYKKYVAQKSYLQK